MWSIFIISIVAFAGVATEGSSCDSNQCLKLLPSEGFDELDVSPGEEELKLLCPHLTAFFKCTHTFLADCVGKPTQELVYSDEETIAKGAKLILALEDISTDLCTEGSKLRNDYVASAECYHNLLEDYETRERCRREAISVYLNYRGLEGETDEEGTVYYETLEDNNSDCMMAAYAIGCYSAQIKKDCGERARATLMELVKRSTLLRFTFCTIEDIEELKTEFLNHLDLEEEHKNIFSLAFDLRKKK